jgi:hypothetical protein
MKATVTLTTFESLIARLRIRARGLEAYSQIMLEAAEEIEAMRDVMLKTEADAALWEERARHLGWRDDREPAQ